MLLNASRRINEMARQVNGIDIKIARLKAGIRQYELAARLGIHPSHLSEIETGRRKPSPELDDRLNRILEERSTHEGTKTNRTS